MSNSVKEELVKEKLVNNRKLLEQGESLPISITVDDQKNIFCSLYEGITREVFDSFGHFTKTLLYMVGEYFPVGTLYDPDLSKPRIEALRIFFRENAIILLFIRLDELIGKSWYGDDPFGKKADDHYFSVIRDFRNLSILNKSVSPVERIEPPPYSPRNPKLLRSKLSFLDNTDICIADIHSFDICIADIHSLDGCDKTLGGKELIWLMDFACEKVPFRAFETLNKTSLLYILENFTPLDQESWERYNYTHLIYYRSRCLTFLLCGERIRMIKDIVNLIAKCVMTPICDVLF